MVSKERIIAGEVSEVYDIELSNNKHVILRISRERKPYYFQEKWALKKLKSVGVPVPEILFIKYLHVNNQDLSMCLMNKVEGEPLERGAVDFNLLSTEEKKVYIFQAGKLLSKIHSIKTEGFGWITGEGVAQYKTPDKLIDGFFEKMPHMFEIAQKESLDNKVIEKAFRVADDFRELYSKSSPHLNHGDYSHKHFMVKNEKIVSIIDWGSIRSDTPIYDFVNWDYWFSHYIPTEWLKDGYEDKTIFNSDFETILHTIRVIKGIEVMEWYFNKYQKGVKEAIEKLHKDLAYFK
jgi:aminoglycoside phosphotransferase (APT) family kinase protein